MNTPSELYYTPSDEWIRLESDGSLTIGITDYAQSELGEIVYAELPETGQTVAADSSFGVVESVKAVGELNCPFAGTIIASNAATADNPGIVNESPYEEGWLIKLQPDAAPDMSGLMDAAAYTAFHA